MKASVEVSSEAAIVVVADAATSLPAALDQDALLQELEPMAVARRAFFFVTDDPVRLHLELYAQEQPPGSLDTHFEPLGGTFGLDVPSGELFVAGWNNEGNVHPTRLSVGERGAHVLRVFGRRPFDVQRHDEEMIALVGEKDYSFFVKVNKSGVIGCLPLVLTAICVLARQWEWLWYLVPLVVGSWSPYVVLKHTERYKEVERAASELEAARPLYVLTLDATEQTELQGGFVRI